MKQNFLLFFIFVMGAALVYVLLEEPAKPMQVKAPTLPVNQESYRNSVNRHLHETSLSIELKRDRERVQQVIPEQGKNYQQENVWHEASSDSDRMQDLAAKLNRTQGQVDESSVESEIQAQLYSDQKLREYDQAYRKAYIDQFIQNARREGYDIKVDYQTLKIRSIRRIN